MPRWRFWDKGEPEPPPAPPPRTAPAGGPIPRPPKPSSPPPPADVERAARLERLRARRKAALFEVEQAESALRPDNPWRQRVALLDEALGTIALDRQGLDDVPKQAGLPVRPLPVTALAVSTADPPSVSFRVGGQQFRYEEELDWAERGTTVVRGELTQRDGDTTALAALALPDGSESDRRALATHLIDSLFSFATDLRNRALEGEPAPSAPTLAEMARPCPACGGWQDWTGRCPTCVERDWTRQRLAAEEERLQRERAGEIEEEARWAERLPVARRRLADLDAELAALGG